MKQGIKKAVRTFRHLNPQWSLIGPSIPNETPLNHQKVATITNAQIPKAMDLFLCERRGVVNTKWSRTWASIRTEKYNVGSCMKYQNANCFCEKGKCIHSDGYM